MLRMADGGPAGQNRGVANSELLYLRDAYLRDFTATVIDVDAAGGRVALDRTAFYPTGGGQPHDTGRLGDGTVVDVRKEGEIVWHQRRGCPAGGRRGGRPARSTGSGGTR